MKVVTPSTKAASKGKKARLAKEIDRERVEKRRKRENEIQKQYKPKGTVDKAKAKATERRTAPKTVQQTLPYKRVCDKYIIQSDTEKFSKTYEFDDVNYTAADIEEQERIALAYKDLLNGFDSTTDAQITLHNNHFNQKEFEKRVTLKLRDDKHDKYRAEMNTMLRDSLLQGQNGILCKKYLTVTVSAIDVVTARQRFAPIETHIRTCFQKIGAKVRALNANERMRILIDVFRGANTEFRDISEAEFIRGGEKSLVSPTYFEFKNDYLMFDRKYARMVFVRELPTSLSDEILTALTRTNLNLMATVNISIVDPAEAAKHIGRQITNIKQEKIEKEKSAAKSGIFSDVLPESLKLNLEQAQNFLSDLQTKNEKMTQVNIVVMVLADSYEELEINSATVDAVFRKYLCTSGAAAYMQEDALASCLPLGNNRLLVRRTLQTGNTIVFMPFNACEVSHDGGLYYGLNQTTNNIILFDRRLLINPNGFILGAPGGGKSFAAKREIVGSYLTTDDDILIIDPEREYKMLAEALGGTVVKVSENSDTYFNPLDIVLVDEAEKRKAGVEDTDDPVKAKLDFFLSFFETIMGSVKPEQKTIIDQALHKSYAPYLADPKPENMPTLHEYLACLKDYDDAEAKILIRSLELYVTGSMDTFAHRTNVDVNSRIVVYDIKDLGKQLKPLGMSVVLENLWVRIVKNRLLGRRTRIYIDEMYLLFGNEHSANFFYELYKRARKWGGIPTGITQNVEDLLRSETGRAMLANTQFILMLNQNTTDRDTLAELLKIPESSMSFVSGAQPGHGLLFASGYGTIPFKDFFPTNTELYKIMTTKFGE